MIVYLSIIATLGALASIGRLIIAWLEWSEYQRWKS
jgi:hypothetical protein